MIALSLVVLVDNSAHDGSEKQDECGEAELAVPRREVLPLVYLFVLRL